ncbi:MAG: 4Fe-4S cluster-binding domain-containing protein, partial [Kiritimatiellae bacterium]|nr:4Fe-4S cluster-binding domain-containing protein [Kiritimatiellia bacterium]
MPQADSQRERVRRNCTLVVTHRCNLRCSYCYEARKDSRSMSEDTALRVMEREFALAASSSDVDELLFDFLGGEPF